MPHSYQSDRTARAADDPNIDNDDDAPAANTGFLIDDDNKGDDPAPLSDILAGISIPPLVCSPCGNPTLHSQRRIGPAYASLPSFTTAEVQYHSSYRPSLS